MTIKRTGKCAVCEKPASERRTFNEQTDMFDAEPKVRLRGDLLREVEEWRASELLCVEHRAGVLV